MCRRSLRFFLTLYAKSAGNYDSMRRQGMLKMPCGRLLGSYKNFDTEDAGISFTATGRMDAAFRSKFGNDEQEGRFGVLAADEMSILQGVFISMATGKIVGFSEVDLAAEDAWLDGFADKEEEDSAPPSGSEAKYLLQFEWTSMNGKFTYCAGYAFTGGATGIQLSRTLSHLLVCLMWHSFYVLGLCFDGAASNQAWIDMLVTPGAHDLFSPEKWKYDGDVGFLAINPVFSKYPLAAIPDPPHLLKTARNNMLVGYQKRVAAKGDKQGGEKEEEDEREDEGAEDEGEDEGGEAAVSMTAAAVTVATDSPIPAVTATSITITASPTPAVTITSVTAAADSPIPAVTVASVEDPVAVAAASSMAVAVAAAPLVPTTAASPGAAVAFPAAALTAANPEPVAQAASGATSTSAGPAALTTTASPSAAATAAGPLASTAAATATPPTTATAAATPEAVSKVAKKGAKNKGVRNMEWNGHPICWEHLFEVRQEPHSQSPASCEHNGLRVHFRTYYFVGPLRVPLYINPLFLLVSCHLFMYY